MSTCCLDAIVAVTISFAIILWVIGQFFGPLFTKSGQPVQLDESKPILYLSYRLYRSETRCNFYMGGGASKYVTGWNTIIT
jgi:hypothetical protein